MNHHHHYHHHHFIGNVRHTMSLAIYNLDKIWLRQYAITYRYKYIRQKYERYMFTHSIKKKKKNNNNK